MLKGKEKGSYMFIKEDNTYQDMIEKSTRQWLQETLESEDVVGRHGAKLTLEYIEHLNKKIEELEDKNALKDEFLRRLKQKKNEG